MSQRGLASGPHASPPRLSLRSLVHSGAILPGVTLSPCSWRQDKSSLIPTASCLHSWFASAHGGKHTHVIIITIIVVVVIIIFKALGWSQAESGLALGFWGQGSLYPLLSSILGLIQAPEAWKAFYRIF